MSIRREEVLHIARLAELDVADADLGRLVEELGRIVGFVDQLNEVPAGEQAPPFLAGPERVALRRDEVGSVPLARSVEQPDGLEEERRLCYVGITRAKDKLYF
ncbi:MAG TPA: 3'-5' exonuclease, partial [Gemmatimonadales bacterium]|nr:3'-5' exonuclease [Gemmatimonadales bacterium]